MQIGMSEMIINSVLYRPNSPQAPNPIHHIPRIFVILIPEPDHPVFKPSQFQKSDPVLVQFLLTGIGIGGSNCQTGVSV